MKRKRMLPLLLIVALLTIAFYSIPSSATEAQSATIKSQIVQINSSVIGKLYQPVQMGDRSKIGFIIMHSNSDYLNHVMAEPLANQGYQVLTANTRYAGQGEGPMIWDNVALDVKAAVNYLKAQPGIEKIVLLGHSGGGPTMAYYQNVAENGVKVAQGPEKLDPASDELANMTPADAVVFLDSHFGYAFNNLVYNDPSILQEGQVWPTNPSLDMYNKANGYDPVKPTYTAEWEKSYFQGQANRMNNLIDIAQSRLYAVNQGHGNYLDNEPLVIARHSARLWMVDLNLISHTKNSHTLLTVNGPVEANVKSVRSPNINKSGQSTGPSDNLSYENGTLVTNMRAFLSTHAVRTTNEFSITDDDITGVDFSSSNSATPANLAGIHVPTLLMSMTAHYWVVPNEINFNYSASPDKTLVYVEGASHGLKASNPKYGDTVKMITDYVTNWTDKRFTKK